MLDEGAIFSKVQYLRGKHGRICGVHKRKGECAIPGEVSSFALATVAEKQREER